jgi:hypothetical protein
MIARVAATSKCKEKPKEAVLAKEPKETPPPYVPLHPPLPPTSSSVLLPLTTDGEAQGKNTPVKSGLEASEALTPPISPGPTYPKSTPICQFSPHTPHSIRETQ